MKRKTNNRTKLKKSRTANLLTVQTYKAKVPFMLITNQLLLTTRTSQDLARIILKI